MKRLVFQVYAAAALGFLASILRDWCLVSYTEFSRDYFQLTYIAALGSSFAINAVTLDKMPSNIVTFLLYSLVSFCVLTTIQISELRLSTSQFFLIFLVQLFWLFGACIAKALITEKAVFLARSRETIASLFVLPAVIAKSSLTFTFMIPILLSTILYFYFSKLKGISVFLKTGRKVKLHFLLRAIFVTNFANSVILIWAMHTNRINDLLFGVDLSILVRFAVYAFQFLVMGSVVLTVHTPKVNKKYNIHMLSLILMIGFGGLFLSFEWPKTSIFFIPILAAISHYFGIVFLCNNGDEINTESELLKDQLK